MVQQQLLLLLLLLFHEPLQLLPAEQRHCCDLGS
jgi:hypothetical protein